MLMVLVLSPSSYAADARPEIARHLYLGTSRPLLWFTPLSMLISLVAIRIILITAQSYGLSQYALEMLVRVLVLELIPVAAALFAALNCTLPMAADTVALSRRDAWGGLGQGEISLLWSDVVPRVVAGLFCALMLVVVSCVVTLVVAYLSVYGLTLAGFPTYTRTVGHVFSTPVTVVFALKILFLSLAATMIPFASALNAVSRRPKTGAELQGLLRLLVAAVVIEACALAGNYF